MEKTRPPRFTRFTIVWLLVVILATQIGITTSLGQGISWTYILSLGAATVIFVLPGGYLYNKALKSDIRNGITLLPFSNILLPWPKPAIGLLLLLLIEIAIVTPLYAYTFNPCNNLDLIRKLNGCVKVFPHKSIETMIFSGDGSVLAISELKGATQIWSYPQMTLMRDLGEISPFIIGMALSSNGELLALCGLKISTIILDSKTGVILHDLLPESAISCGDFAFTPDDKFLISSGQTGLQIWDTATGKLVEQLDKEWTHRLAISPDGSLLAADSANGTINIWRLADRTILRKMVSPYVQDMVISADGKYLITTTWDVFAEPKVEPINASSTIKVWNISNGDIENTITFPRSNIRYLSATNNGNGFAASEDSCFEKKGFFGPFCAYYWKTATRTTPFILRAPQSMRPLLFSPTDNRLLSSDYRSLYFWQVP